MDRPIQDPSSQEADLLGLPSGGGACVPRRSMWYGLRWVFKALVSAIALLLLIFSVDWTAALATIRHARLGFLVLQMTVLLMVMLLQSVRTGVLCRHWGDAPPFGGILKTHLAGFTTGIFLPSSLSGDLVRFLAMRKYLDGHVISASVIFAERLAGLFGRVAVVALPLIWTTNAYRQSEIITIAAQGAVAVAGVVAIAIVLLASSRRILAPLFRMLLPRRLYGRVALLSLEVAPLSRRPRLQVTALGWSFSIAAVNGLTTYFLIRSVGGEIGLLDAIALGSLINIVACIPVSLGGLGVVDGSALILLSQAGVPADISAAVVVLRRVCGVVFAAASLPFCREVFRDVLRIARQRRCAGK